MLKETNSLKQELELIHSQEQGEITAQEDSETDLQNVFPAVQERANLPTKENDK